jgi:hypothetical protein
MGWKGCIGFGLRIRGALCPALGKRNPAVQEGDFHKMNLYYRKDDSPNPASLSKGGGMKSTAYFIVAAVVAACRLFALDVSFKIQETTGNAADDYPVTFTVPLPAWTYADVSSFRVTDAGGATVPAQISVLNKQWQAGYLRHVLVTLKTSLAASEQKVFHFKDDGGNPSGGGALSVTETSSDVTVVTGPLKFKIRKQNFNLFDEAYLDLNNNGAFEAAEQVIMSSPNNGGIFTDRYGAVQKS